MSDNCQCGHSIDDHPHRSSSDPLGHNPCTICGPRRCYDFDYERAPSAPLVTNQYDAPAAGHKPEDILRITAHDLTALQNALSLAKKTIERRAKTAEDERLRWATALQAEADRFKGSQSPYASTKGFIASLMRENNIEGLRPQE